MKKNNASFRKIRYHTSGRRTFRLLIQGHSAGFALGDADALSETLADPESGRRFTRGATALVLQQLCGKHTL